MSLIASLILAGFTSTAMAESPYIHPVSLESFSEWTLNSKIGYVGSVDIEGTIEVPLYADQFGAPTLKTFVTTDATEEGERGDLFTLVPETSLIIVSEDFAKRNELEIKVTNKRLIPVPDDFKVGGEIKYVEIPSLNVGGMVLRDVVALISGSEEEFAGKMPALTLGLGAVPTSYAFLHSKGVVQFSNDGAGLMNAIGAKGVPYQSQTFLVGTQGKWTLTGKNKTIVYADQLIVDATIGGATVPTSLRFNRPGSSLDKYIEASSESQMYKLDVRKDWMSGQIGETTFPATYIDRKVKQPYSDGLTKMANIGFNVLVGFDIVVDKTSQSIGMVANNGFTFAPYYDIYLENARKALEPKETETKETGTKETGTKETGTTEGDAAESTDETPALNVRGINGLIDALETNGSYAEALEQYALLIADAEESTDCALWLNYGHANRKLGKLDEAHKAYTESARLYHSWWDIELGQRMDINKAQEKMEEEEIEAAKERSKDAAINSVEDGWYISQPEQCYVADGVIAAVDMLKGNYENVEANYRQNLDLGTELPLALGNSALIQGNTELAHEAYRQAIRLESGLSERGYNRAGLAMVYADQGKWEQANDLFMESLELLDNPLTAIVWFNNATAQTTTESAVKMLEAWNASHPTHVAGRVALLQHLKTAKVAAEKELAAFNTPPETVDGTTVVEESKSKNKNKKGKQTEEPVVATVDLEKQALLQANVDALTAQLKTAQESILTWAGPNMNNINRWFRDNPAQSVSSKILLYTLTENMDAAQKELMSVTGVWPADVAFAAANYHAWNGDSTKAMDALNQSVLNDPWLPSAAITLRK